MLKANKNKNNMSMCDEFYNKYKTTNLLVIHMIYEYIYFLLIVNKLNISSKVYQLYSNNVTTIKTNLYYIIRIDIY